MTGGVGTFGFGTGPELDAAFQVLAAVSLSSTLVRVDFSAALDPSHPPNFNVVNYTIDGLVVVNVDPWGSNSVIIQTSPQSEGVHEVVVNATPGRIRALDAGPLDPDYVTAGFDGAAVKASFTATAQSSRKVRLEFSEPMPDDEVFTDPANFVLRRVDGFVATIESIVGLDGTRAQLILGQDLTPMAYFSVQVGALIVTAAGHPIVPGEALFQWKRSIARPIRIVFDRFSGEVTGGLLGNPGGQIFLSPAFGASAANSVIQVDRVSVCTRAHDVYQRPPEPEARVASFLGPATAPGPLGPPLVLWAPAHRFGQPAMRISDVQSETMPGPVEGPAEGLLIEPIDITRASFLNDDRWRIYPGVGASLGPFRTADNLTFIGPGSSIGPFAIP